MPRITVLMPTFNVAPWVKDAIDSVLAQSYADFELMVLDDCSSDNTLEIVEGISDSRIRIVRGERNVGLADNLNRGIELSQSEFLARMDGDDIAEPDWLQRGVEVLDSHPDIGICSFGFQFFGTKSSRVRFPEKHEDSMAQMLLGCTVIVPVFRRRVFVDNNLRYKTSAFPAEDYQMWSECYKVTKVYNVQKTCFHYRMHGTQITTSRRLEQAQKADMVRVSLLKWMNPEIPDILVNQFVHLFIPCKISCKDDILLMRRISKEIIQMNVRCLFSRESLSRIFESHIINATIVFCEEEFFSSGYSIPSFIKLVKNGLYWHLPMKYKYKTIVKCLMIYR